MIDQKPKWDASKMIITETNLGKLQAEIELLRTENRSLVYILEFSVEYEGLRIEGIFSTFEKAQNALKAYINNHYRSHKWEFTPNQDGAHYGDCHLTINKVTVDANEDYTE